MSMGCFHFLGGSYTSLHHHEGVAPAIKVLQPFSSILVSIHLSESQEEEIIVLCQVMCPPFCFVVMLRQFTA